MFPTQPTVCLFHRVLSFSFGRSQVQVSRSLNNLIISTTQTTAIDTGVKTRVNNGESGTGNPMDYWHSKSHSGLVRDEPCILSSSYSINNRILNKNLLHNNNHVIVVNIAAGLSIGSSSRSKLGLNGVSCNYSTTPFNINRNVIKDTLVFSHNNDNFFKFLSIFGIVQMLMWGYLSLFSVQELRSGPTIKKDTSDLPWWQKFLYTEGRYKNALSIMCFTVGASIFFIASTYPRRAVTRLSLLKGGRNVEITTYSWLGRTHSFKTPVDHINCIQARTGSGSQVPFKIKNKHFFFLLDKQGDFHNPDLFDYVIGLERKL